MKNGTKQGSSLKVVQTNNAPKPIGPYSQGIVSEGFMFTAGVIGLDPKTGNMVTGGIREQTKRVLDSLDAILEQGGSSLDKVVKTTVYLKETSLFKDMNEVYSLFFTNHKPPRSTIVCSFMREDVLIEIDAIAKI